MERDALMEVMFKYNEDRSHFGKGPTRPHKTGHCSNESCGDAVGVRVWFRYENNPGIPKLYDKYVRDIWWTGDGCTCCLGAAAAMVPKLLGMKVTSDEAIQAIVDARNEFVNLPEDARLCTDTAILAFVRAVFHQFYTKTDWTEEDLDSSRTPSDELDIFCCNEQTAYRKPFDDGDLYEW